MTGAPATAGVEESDVVLLARARSGDEEAFAALWRRHLAAAHAAATSFRGRVSAEDLVAEASARLFRLLSEGRGPSSNFRAYFVSTVRTVGVDAVRREMSVVTTSTTDLDLLPGPDDGLSALGAQGVDTDLVREAFLRLSEADRLLLWQTMVEGHPPRVVAPELGVSANVASARARRARDELRDRYLDSWVRRRVPVCDARDCRWTLDHLSGHVRGRLTERQGARVEAHLARCPREAGLAVELQRVYDGFGALTGPIVLAVGAAMFGSLPGGASAALVGSSTTGATTGAATGATTGVTAGAGAAGGTAGAGAAGTSAGSALGGAAAGSTGLGGTLTVSGAGATASGTATAGAGLTAGATSVSATTTAACVGGGGGAALTAPAGVAATTALVSSAAIVTPVAAWTGGSILAGTAIGPPLATAMAGLVVGLGLSVAPAAAHDLGTTTTSVVSPVDGVTQVLSAGSEVAPEAATTPVDLLHLDLLPAPSDPAPSDATSVDPASSDPAPSDATSVDPAPSDPAPSDATSVDSAPSDPAPSDATSVDSAPSDPALSDATSVDPAPSDPALSDAPSVDPAPSDPAPSDSTSVDPSLSDSTSVDPVPSDQTSSDSTSVDPVPSDQTPSDSTSVDPAPSDPAAGRAPTNAESSSAAENGHLRSARPAADPPAGPPADPPADAPSGAAAPAQAADGPATAGRPPESPTGDAHPAGA
ncbi:sigma-70 family RNA polymerase sigma factor [Terrabacter sp. Soil810]|uniref:sigma-70 family RNA polymerase sigma factor n=1 Tax=Terrabacter sp. Soil810 TaxID=1736418 RepID=UPI000709C320|nr:sigma-70 family RNA polymerase sigma factor [Terrabacter sp. Soil810]KRF47132.1 hypothetical protein ASG96_03795 [Terrabacter sp. Soil810]